MCTHMHVFGTYVYMHAYFLNYKLTYGHCRNTDWRIKKKMYPITEKLLPLTFGVFSRESSDIFAVSGKIPLDFLGFGVCLRNKVKIIFRCLTLEVCDYIFFLKFTWVY